MVRLRSINAIADDGASGAKADSPFALVLEMGYQVLQPGYVITPSFDLYNEEGVCVFVTADADPDWYRRPKALGRYVSRVTVPGNFLREGTLIVDASISTADPVTVHAYEREAVAFRVIDSGARYSMRGTHAARVRGVVRPRLDWRTNLRDEFPVA